MIDFELTTTTKGKNFRARNPAKARKGDLFETPYSMTWQLLEKEWFSSCEVILEPAAGNGAIVRALEDKLLPGAIVNWYDIAAEGKHGLDFLTVEWGPVYSYIITNPPYTLATEFILKAKEVAAEKFAFLLPLDYLHGQDRFNRLYHDDEYALARVWVFTRRPNLESKIREDGKYPTGTLTFAWFVWDKRHRGPYQGGWIDNQKYVLSKADL